MKNNISRRAALAALAGAGAITSVPAASALLDTGAPAAPAKDEHGEGYTDAMDAFAMGWLTRWTQKGGSVTFDPTTGKAWIGHAVYSETRRQATFLAEVREQDWFKQLTEEAQRGFIDRRRAFEDAFFTGQMRELSDLLDAVPGGLEAVKRIVRAFPSAGLAPVFATQAQEA